MHIIDRYAYTNRIRAVDPAYKAGLALAVLGLCLVLDEPAVGILAAAWMLVLAVGLARLPAAVFGRLLLGELGFLLLVTAGVAVSVTVREPAARAVWAWHAGPLWFSAAPEGVELAARLVARAFGATAAMNFLAMTTPLVDIVDLMRRCRVPAILIDLMTVMYRFIFVLLDGLERMYRAQDSRLGYFSVSRGMVSAGLLGGRLFIETYRRSCRLQLALDARGYDGELRVLPTRYERGLVLPVVGAVVVASMFLAWRIL